MQAKLIIDIILLIRVARFKAAAHGAFKKQAERDKKKTN